MEVVFIIIFVLLCVYAVAQGNTETVNKETEKAKKEALVNRDFERELIKKITNPTYREEILELIKDDLQYIYGDVWKELFDVPWRNVKSYTPKFENAENIVFMLMLSKSGLIPDGYQFFGIKISNYEIANSYESLRILQCVEKNIQQKRKSDDYKLVFCPYVEYKKTGKHSGINTPKYDLPCSGQFRWMFESLYSNSRYAIKNIHDPVVVRACKNSALGERSDKEKNNPYKDKLVL
ncbi:MAG: hypothetical protein IJB72_07130 [Clostridia bacterium]|nr:hypothetical protein [Clostridia bacterium]